MGRQEMVNALKQCSVLIVEAAALPHGQSSAILSYIRRAQGLLEQAIEESEMPPRQEARRDGQTAVVEEPRSVMPISSAEVGVWDVMELQRKSQAY